MRTETEVIQFLKILRHNSVFPVCLVLWLMRFDRMWFQSLWGNLLSSSVNVTHIIRRCSFESECQQQMWSWNTSSLIRSFFRFFSEYSDLWFSWEVLAGTLFSLCSCLSVCFVCDTWVSSVVLSVRSSRFWHALVLTAANQTAEQSMWEINTLGCFTPSGQTGSAGVRFRIKRQTSSVLSRVQFRAHI